MTPFKSIALRPTTGYFDSLSSPDEVGWGNWRLVKNCVTRAPKNRSRGGGWRRFRADDDQYNNQDLHDQLIGKQSYYDQYTISVDTGGELQGYDYPYFAPSTVIPAYNIFPPADGPFCGYIGDYRDGLFGDCSIVESWLGYPYEQHQARISLHGLVSRWGMDTYLGGAAVDSIAGHDLALFSPAAVASGGKLGSCLTIGLGGLGVNSSGAFVMGDIKFGGHMWIRPTSLPGSQQHILGRWQQTGNQREWRLIMTAGSKFQFDVSNNGTAVVSATDTTTLSAGVWYFVAFWHDPIANTINIKVNSGTTVSTAHSTGVFSGSAIYMGLGYDETTSSGLLRASIDEMAMWRGNFPSATDLAVIYHAGIGLEYPWAIDTFCDTGASLYWAYSYLYTSCPISYAASIVPGFPYGDDFPVYAPQSNYDLTYCGTSRHGLPGCKEAITLITEVVTASSRKTIAATLSRVYELNQSAGNWKIIADGLGSPIYSEAQCTCNSVRGMSASLGGYFMFTNNFDPPMLYYIGDEATTCDLNSLQPIADLAVLGITRAGGVVEWNGFVFFFDITEEGVRQTGKIIWSDLNEPMSFIESDTSAAGFAILGMDETILNAAPLGNWLMIYTDRNIYRCTLVGGEDVFNFEAIHQGDNEGTDALFYKFSLINAGGMHIYAGRNEVFSIGKYDIAPQVRAWINRAAGIMFNGLSEDDAQYDKINDDACNLVTGGWNAITEEAWISWPTGSNVCPNVTLRLNLKYQTADLIDHGFTAMATIRPDSRPTVGQWLEDMDICPPGSKVATGEKDGAPCPPAAGAFDPPAYIRNATEDTSLPVHPDSLCAELGGRTLDDFCESCFTKDKFVMASASDFALKQSEDLHYYREMLVPVGFPGYSIPGCSHEAYVWFGYDSVMQMGLETFKSDTEKMINRVDIEAVAKVQATPSELECEVGYGSQPGCITWVASEPKDFECVTDRTAAQHTAQNTRQSGQYRYPFWRRGAYLAARFRISGVGGGGDFGAMHLWVKNWGHTGSP